MAVEERTELLKDRAKKLRRLKNACKPIRGSDGRFFVETDLFGKPNGKGRSELVHFLSVKTRHTLPTGIIHSEEIANLTYDQIVKQAEERFDGKWTSDWAKEIIRATIRQRRAKIIKMLREDKKKLQSSLTKERYKEAQQLLKNPNFLRNLRD